MSESQRYPKPTAHVAVRAFEGEVVLVDSEHNMIRMLNEVGSRIWMLADGSRTATEIACRLTEEYEIGSDEAQLAVDEFLRELTAKKLLCWDPSAP